MLNYPEVATKSLKSTCRLTVFFLLIYNGYVSLRRFEMDYETLEKYLLLQKKAEERWTDPCKHPDDPLSDDEIKLIKEIYHETFKKLEDM